MGCFRDGTAEVEYEMTKVISQSLISSRFHRLSKINPSMPDFNQASLVFKKAKIIIAAIILVNVSLLSQIDDSWYGVWQGKLEIESSPYGLRNSIPMELHISAADTAGVLNWRIIYNDSATDDRKYLLRIVDAEKGKYVIDEKDGIQLEANLFRNKLISRFEVMGSLLEISYSLETDKIIFGVTSGKITPSLITQSEQEQIEVKSYEVTSSQAAILYKIK